MSRLQKKCFLGATSLHGLLLLALLVGPGFFSKQTVDDSPVIEFIPMMASPDNSTGGGSPRPPANPPPQNVVSPQPRPTPPPPEVKPEVAKVEPEKAEKPEPEKVNRTDPDALESKPEKPKKHQVKTSTTVVKIAKNSTAKPNRSTTTSANNAEAKANEALQKAFANAGRNISSGLSSSTRVDMPEGPGGGGVSYAPYGQIVRTRYTDGWIVPDDMTDDEATVKVSVTIARDGRVISSSILQRSGSAAADRSIQNTLDRIRTIGVPFPAGAKESQRTFIMTFNLKAKKAFG